jgi:hypothetical protein
MILVKLTSDNRYAWNTRLHSRISITPYHSSKNVYIRIDDPNFPASYFDPLINTISLRGFTPKNASLVVLVGNSRIGRKFDEIVCFDGHDVGEEIASRQLKILDDKIDCVVGILDTGDGNVADLKMFDVSNLI